ncbi:MAG: CHAT domain-containing protein [Rubrivivax sp.]|nr:MAG: CHAT domain-containing protein [Rubrivivax sp.]
MGAAAKYLDFDLQITKEGDQYMAEVRNSPAGPSRKCLLHWPFGFDSHEKLLLELQVAVLKSRGYRGGPLTTEEAVLRDFGRDVYSAVFRPGDPVDQKFAASFEKIQLVGGDCAGLRLKLRVEPPELAMLPWEYMFEESNRVPLSQRRYNYLCLRERSPLVRVLDVEGALAPSARANGPLRILGMISNPGGMDWELLDTEAERRRIEEALKDIPKSAVHFEWVRGGEPDSLFQAMEDSPWHIFHFIGHGGTERHIDEQGQIRTEGFVVMQDGIGGAVKVAASQLGLMLEGNRDLRLAVLNCCDSGRGGAFSSAGAAVVMAGVPMAVAMQFPISNGGAARFAGQFYKSLISGQPVEQALTTARRFMSLESNVEWGIPVLFTQAGASVVFEVELHEADPAEAPHVAAAALVASDQQKRRAQAQEELRRLFM